MSTSGDGAGVTGGRDSRDLQFVSNFDLSVGKKHALRFGALLRDLNVTSDERRNGNGSFTFSDLAAFAAVGRPLLAPGGLLVAMKGLLPENELAALPSAIASAASSAATPRRRTRCTASSMRCPRRSS